MPALLPRVVRLRLVRVRLAKSGWLQCLGKPLPVFRRGFCLLRRLGVQEVCSVTFASWMALVLAAQIMAASR